MADGDVLLCFEQYVNGITVSGWYGPISATLIADKPFDSIVEDLLLKLLVKAREASSEADVIIGIEFESDPFIGWYLVRGTAGKLA